jgi:cytidyltransferase-like protein
MNLNIIDYIKESKGLRPVVIYGGKFQPFHAGHYEIYQKLVKEFGKKNVFISTADLNKSKLKNSTYIDNHIFTFDEKCLILEKMFNIPREQVMVVKRSPYLPSWKEIPVEGSDYALISICGEKDKERFDELGNETMTVQEYKPGMKLESCLDHKYYYILENEKVHLSATEVRNFFRENHDEDDKKEFFKEVFGKFNQEIYDLVNNRINHIFESRINESFVHITEGKVAGHIQHLHNDLNITFNDLEEIIDLGFSSNLEEAVEKVDGNPLAMTYKNGEFLFAYADQPKSMNDLEFEFIKDLPKKVYRNACERLIRAFKDNPKTKEWFTGNRLLHMEILSSEMPNMIRYNRDAVVLHYMVEYDENGKTANRNRDLAIEIASEMKNNDEKIEIVGPPFVRIKDIDCTSIKNKLKKEIESMIVKSKTSKETSLLDYLITLTKDFCSKHGADVNDRQATLITKKWLGLNKTHQFTSRAYKSQDLIDNLTELDKSKGPKFVTDEYNDVKVLIASICVNILKCMKTYVAKDINDGASSIRKILDDAIKELNDSGEIQTDKLSNALKRLEKLGFENLFPSEGIIFNFKGKMYKITGMFADYIALSNVIRTKIKNNEYTR